MIECNDYSYYKKSHFNKDTAVSLGGMDVRCNLGLRHGKKNKEEKWRTNKFCGYCWLKNKSGETIKSDSGIDQILHIETRFKGLQGDRPSPIINMINTIASDDEFMEYLCLDLPEGERLITYFYDEELIEAEDIKEDNRLLTAISYIELLYRTTRRSVMSKAEKKSENLTGKVRGKIDIKHQISHNIAKGRKERIYCQYAEKTADIIENQALKYALKQASAYLSKYMKPISDEISRKIQICKRRLEKVSDVRVSERDIDTIFLPNMYQSYQPLLKLAKIIISEISMTPSNENAEKGIIPYAVNMPLLFECYVRARIKEALKDLNENVEITHMIKMLRFVSDKHNIDGSVDEYGYRNILKEKSKCYLSGKIVPDIVLAYYDKTKLEETGKTEPDFYRVYDVKYKSLLKKNPQSVRGDRLQILAYTYLFNGNNNVGLIFPVDPEEENKTDPIINPKIKVAEINQYKFDQEAERDLYAQIVLDGSKIVEQSACDFGDDEQQYGRNWLLP